MNLHKRRGGRDRLSDLPDDNILRILSFVGTKQAVQTSTLSRRWRYIWTSMTCLNFLSEEFDTLTEFSEFVRRVLSGRNHKLQVFSVKLTLSARHGISKNIYNQETAIGITEKILKYAFSRNLQQLNITCLHGQTIRFHQSLLSSKSLRYLTLDGYTYQPNPSSTWDLPALETLNLYHFTIYNSDMVPRLFSRLAKLKNLALKNCKLKCFNGFNIRHDGLSSLTLEEGRESIHTRVNLETPQLQNLRVRNWLNIRLVSTPNLSSLHYIDYMNGIEKVNSRLLYNGPCEDCDDFNCHCNKDRCEDCGYYDCVCDNPCKDCGYYDCVCDNPCKDCGDYDCECDRGDDDYYEGVYPLRILCELYKLEKVNICIDRPIEKEEDIRKLISLLQKLQSVRRLTLSWELVELLTPFVESAPRLPFYYNLESVKVYPLSVFSMVKYRKKWEFKKVQVEVPTTFENYLLEGSKHFADLSIVSHEETMAMNNLTLARNVISELQVALENWRKELSVETVYEEQEPASSLDILSRIQCKNSEMLRRLRESDLQMHKQHRAKSLLLLLCLAMSRVPASSHQDKLKATYNTLLDETIALLKLTCGSVANQFCKDLPRLSD